MKRCFVMLFVIAMVGCNDKPKVIDPTSILKSSDDDKYIPIEQEEWYVPRTKNKTRLEELIEGSYVDMTAPLKHRTLKQGEADE